MVRKQILKPLELAQAQNELLFTRTVLPTHKKLIIYARQSTAKQVVNNKESAAQQTDDLRQHAIEIGWQEENIVLFVENYYDRYGKLTDKIRRASGRLRIDQRAGLSIVTDMIRQDEAGAILIWDVSRLFRDETMIMPAIFAELCREHHVLVLTPDTIFDFNNPRNDDRKRFLDEAQNAADYLSRQVKKMNKARMRKALRGEFAGHRLPTGLMLDEERKHFLPSPHAPQVDALFKRYRQLNGDFAALRREVVGKPIFPDLPEGFPIDKLTLTKIEGGYTVKSRENLRRMLTNPVYVGHMVWNGHIVKRNAHPAIVDESDFFFAFNRLSDFDLDGLPIEHPERTVRYVQIHGLPYEALLWGVRPGGQAVITSPGRRVHVQRSIQYPKKASYTIYDSSKIAIDQSVASITVARLDEIFTERLMYRIASDMVNFGIKSINGKPLDATERAEGWYAHFRQVQQDAEISLSTVDDTVEETQKEIARIERRLDVAQDTMSDEDIRKNYEKLRRLRLQLTDMEKKQAKQQVSDSELRETAHDVASLPESWQEMSLERKRRFISLVTERIELVQRSDRWLKLSIHWTPYFQFNIVDECYIFQQDAGKAWTKEELHLLREHYRTASRAWLLEHLPRRSWQSMKNQASKMKLTRFMQRSDTALPVSVSLMDEYGIMLETAYKGHWWQTVHIYNGTPTC